jgi:hypothetical protein
MEVPDGVPVHSVSRPGRTWVFAFERKREREWSRQLAGLILTRFARRAPRWRSEARDYIIAHRLVGAHCVYSDWAHMLGEDLADAFEWWRTELGIERCA